MPRSKKPAGTAANPRNGSRLELVATDQKVIPPAPRGLRRKIAKDTWESYWQDALSGLVQESERMIVERWVRNIDRYEVLMSICAATPFELGSTGQTVKHPAWSIAAELERSIRADEAQIGYGPKNRAALGIAVVQQQASLAELNQRYGPQEAEAVQDPRLVESGQ